MSVKCGQNKWFKLPIFKLISTHWPNIVSFRHLQVDIGLYYVQLCHWTGRQEMWVQYFSILFNKSWILYAVLTLGSKYQNISQGAIFKYCHRDLKNIAISFLAISCPSLLNPQITFVVYPFCSNPRVWCQAVISYWCGMC